MQFIVPPASLPHRLGLLPGAFNPPTRAHLAMAEAALSVVDEVLLVLPAVLPHKEWEGATPDQRAEMLRLLTSGRPRIGSAFATAAGLFVEIAREARVLYPATDLYLICGRDAAERIVGWDYGRPGAIAGHLEEFRLLVAPRAGPYQPPAHVAHAVHSLAMGCHDEYASTRIRNHEEGWRELVPDEIAHLVASIY